MMTIISLGLCSALTQQPAPNWPTSAGPAPLITQFKPLPTPAEQTRSWLERRRRLRIQFGISAGVFFVSGIGLTIAVTRPGGCDSLKGCPDDYPVAAIITGIATSVALIPSLVYAVRLAIHNERRPQTERLALTAGGLRVRF